MKGERRSRPGRDLEAARSVLAYARAVWLYKRGVPFLQYGYFIVDARCAKRCAQIAMPEFSPNANLSLKRAESVRQVYRQHDAPRSPLHPARWENGSPPRNELKGCSSDQSRR
jgi:hypothetical protein